MSAARSRSAASRTLARISGVAALVGLVVLAFAAYQLWGTGLQESNAQASLRSDLNAQLSATTRGQAPTTNEVSAVTEASSESASAVPSATIRSTTTTPITSMADASGATTAVEPHAPEIDESDQFVPLAPAAGDAVAQLSMPSIGVDKVVVSGIAAHDLRRAPGHYATTALPGNTGNVGFAGHRTTYGAPFGDIDLLAPGDEIVVATVQGTFRYRVMDPTSAFSQRLDDVIDVANGHIIVDPSATWVLANFNDNRLTLTACHPRLSNRQRIVVGAELIGPSIELPANRVQPSSPATILADEYGR